VRSQLICALARLGSIDYQKAFVVEGTMAEYVMPVELIEDVDGLIHQSARAEYSNSFSDLEKTALAEIAEFIDLKSGEALEFKSRADAIEKIMNGIIWMELRYRAEQALSALNVDLSRLTLPDMDAN
jgi:hypothetical protein